MEIKILNSILHSELKPWLFDISDTGKLKEIIRNASKIEPITIENINSRLQYLLKPFPDLLKTIEPVETKNLQQPVITVMLPKPYDVPTTYYHLLISTETIRYFNTVINNPYIIDKVLDVPYQIEHKVLKVLASLANETQNTLIQDGFIDESTMQSSSVQFALISLRNSLITLYFSVQSLYKEFLTDVYDSIDDFYLFKMDSDLNKVSLAYSHSNQEVISIAKSDNKKFGFGFKGDEAKLKNLILILCNHKNLLDETITKPNELIELLTTSDIQNKKYKIQFGCKTNLVAYILASLKKSIPKLTNANIDRCGYFFTENGIKISQSLLSNSKSNNPLSKQTKEEIDNYFKENGI